MSYLVTKGVAESDWLGVRVQVLIPPDKRDTDSVKYSHIVRLHTWTLSNSSNKLNTFRHIIDV